MKKIIVRVKADFILNIKFTLSVPWTNGAIMSSTTQRLRFEETDNNFRIPSGMAFESTNFSLRISS